MEHYFSHKEIDLKINSRRYLSTYPNTNKSFSYSYYYGYNNGDFIFLQCKDNNKNIKSPDSCIEYTLFRHNNENDDIEILKNLIFYNRHHKIIHPQVASAFFMHNDITNSFVIYIIFSNNKTYEFNSDMEYNLSNCETWKESNITLPLTQKINNNSNVIVVKKDDETCKIINDKLELCVDEDF
jgi:hypothetical protein